MRGSMKWTLLSATLVAAACGRQSSPTAEGGLDEALQRDLALASAQSVELAGRGRAGQSIVSAAERIPEKRRPAPAPKRAQASRPEPQPEPVEIGNEPEQIVEVATAVASQTEELPQPVPAPMPEPTVIPVAAPTAGPAPLPMPAGDGGYGEGERGARGRGGWGGVIGVVIRGGAVGEDDCKIHDRRRGGGVIAVNDRIRRRGPSGIPAGTFPTRSSGGGAERTGGVFGRGPGR